MSTYRENLKNAAERRDEIAEAINENNVSKAIALLKKFETPHGCEWMVETLWEMVREA